MTVAIIYDPVRLAGSASVIAYAFPWRIFENTDVLVRKVLKTTNVAEAPLVNVDDYDVVINTTTEGGNVTPLVAVGVLFDLIIESVIPSTQPTNVPNVGGVREEQLEDPYDRGILLDQINKYFLSKCIKISTEDETIIAGFDSELKNIIGNALLSYTADGKGVTSTVLAALDAFGYPASNGIMVATGGLTAIARVLQGIDGITIADPDGVNGNPTISGAKLAESLLSGNHILNGNFDIWQDGDTISAPADNEYTAEMWLAHEVGGTISSVAKQTHTLGQTVVPGNPKFFQRTSVSVAGDTGTAVRMEGVERLSGKLCTVTIYAKTSVAGNSKIQAVNIVQDFGSGGGSGDVTTSLLPDVAVGTSFIKIQGTVTLPSIAGKTLGSGNNDFLELRIDFDEAFVGDFDISHVSLVEGDVTGQTDPFGEVDLGDLLSKVQRFYQTIVPDDDKRVVKNAAVGTTTIFLNYDYPVHMRAIPTLVVFGDIGASEISSWGATNNFIDGFNISNSIGAGGFLSLHYYTANARL